MWKLRVSTLFLLIFLSNSMEKELFRAIYIRHHSGADEPFFLEQEAYMAAALLDSSFFTQNLTTSDRQEEIITQLFNFHKNATINEAYRKEFIKQYVQLHGCKKWKFWQYCSGVRAHHIDHADQLFVKLVNRCPECHALIE